MSALDLCEKYFETRDIYKLFEVPKDALTKDIKKAYYKLSLQVHPDRVTEEEKEVATEKFKVLSKIYQVLTDKDKRAIYDEQGIIDDEDDLDSKLTNWMDLWRKLFKPLTTEDISNYQKTYVNSELERTDMKKAYLSGSGCINHIMDEVPFFKVEDEPRLKKIIGEMIAANEVPEYKMFTEEPERKRKRRHAKYARESREAANILKEMEDKKAAENDDGGFASLEKQIMERAKARQSSYDSLMDRLAEKYGGDDDSEVLDFSKLDKKKSKKTNGTKKTKAVKNGKVKKR